MEFISQKKIKMRLLAPLKEELAKARKAHEAITNAKLGYNKLLEI